MMESLTEEVYQKAKQIVDEVEEMGGMAKAVGAYIFYSIAMCWLNIVKFKALVW